MPARLFRNFTFHYRKKAKKKSRKRSNIVQLADGVTALAQLYALYSHRARSFNQWQRALYPNFIINRTRSYTCTLNNYSNEKLFLLSSVKFFILVLVKLFKKLTLQTRQEIECDATFNCSDIRPPSSLAFTWFFINVGMVDVIRSSCVLSYETKSLYKLRFN